MQVPTRATMNQNPGIAATKGQVGSEVFMGGGSIFAWKRVMYDRPAVTGVVQLQTDLSWRNKLGKY